MLSLRCLRRFNNLKRCMCKTSAVVNVKNYSKKPDDDSNEPQIGDMASKYKPFKEEDSEIILDVYEERLKYSEAVAKEEAELLDPFEGINLERGERGVFDIEDMIEVLKKENGQDIFVAAVPPEISYVDYICIVSAKSSRHMKAIAQFVRRVFKRKRHKGDIVPILEGADSKDWMAMDLGNIALHIFSKEARVLYDLDSLWAVGSKYDKEYNKVDPIATMLEKHSYYLGQLQPAS